MNESKVTVRNRVVRRSVFEIINIFGSTNIFKSPTSLFQLDVPKEVSCRECHSHFLFPKACLNSSVQHLGKWVKEPKKTPPKTQTAERAL